jgi:hypothetical protein
MAQRHRGARARGAVRRGADGAASPPPHGQPDERHEPTALQAEDVGPDNPSHRAVSFAGTRARGARSICCQSPVRDRGPPEPPWSSSLSHPSTSFRHRRQLLRPEGIRPRSRGAAPRLTLSMHRTIHPCPSVRKPERTDDGPRPAEGETDRHRATPKQPRRPRGLKIQSSGTLNQTAAVPGHRRPPTAARAGKPKAPRALDVIFREFPTASRKFDTTADRLLPRMTGADVPDRCPASERPDRCAIRGTSSP